MIVLCVFTDGRDHIYDTIPSALAQLEGPITRRVINDDSGDRSNTDRLRRAFPTFEVITHPVGRQGFGGAIWHAWQHLAMGPERFVFHCEDDFLFNQSIDLLDLAEVLDDHPYLVQLALRRQPWNDEERAAGGIVEQHPTDYTDCFASGAAWLEHRRFFTTNPSLYRRDLCILGWPDCQYSEGVFTHQLLEDPALRFGFWGARDSGEWVKHTGDERAGVGY